MILGKTSLRYKPRKSLQG